MAARIAFGRHDKTAASPAIFGAFLLMRRATE